MEDLLYRGVNKELHAKLGGKLQPKQLGLPFARNATWDIGSWDDSDWNESDQNGVVEHQQDQAGLPTSGVSTTPHFERARFYATGGGRHSEGFIYVIATERLANLGVSSFRVNELLGCPSVPEDDEVILVAKAFGVLPSEAVVQVLEVAA